MTWNHRPESETNLHNKMCVTFSENITKLYQTLLNVIYQFIADCYFDRQKYMDSVKSVFVHRFYLAQLSDSDALRKT